MDELAQLKTWLMNRDIKLIGLQGIGGIGKSAFASRLYLDQSIAGTFTAKFWADVGQQPDFAIFAEQALIELGGLSRDQIAQLDENELPQQLLRCLNQKRCLLVIDNLETLLNEAREWRDANYERFFVDWVERGRTSTLLITTQEKPALFQPELYWLSLFGLDTKAGGTLLEKAGIDGEFAELEAFAAKVDGHPLTLKLVAAFWREYCHHRLASASELGLTEIDQLAEQAKGLHRSKQDVCLDWILQQHFQRLTPEQQEFLTYLSVYRQPFNDAAAAWMLPSEEQPTDITLTQQALRELYNRSLLQETSDGHYQFQPLVKRFVQQQIGDLNGAHSQALHYWQSVSTSADTWKTLNDLSAYLEAIYHYSEQEQYAQSFRVIYCCDDFLSLQGYNNIRIELYEELLHRWELVGIERWKHMASLISLGTAYSYLGQYQRAIEFHQQHLEIARDIGNRQGEANSLGSLGNAYSYLGQYQRAIEFHQQHLEIARDIGDRQGEAAALGNLGTAYSYLGQYQRGIELHQQSLEIERDIGNRRGEARSLQNLAALYQRCGRVQEGLKLGSQASQILQELDLPLEAWPLPNWVKQMVQFAQRGKWQLGLCFVLGIVAFLPALIAYVALLIWCNLKAMTRQQR